MLPPALDQALKEELDRLKRSHLYKQERVITSMQGDCIALSSRGKVLNFCSNNYLGLSSAPEVIRAAKEGLDRHGFGMSSVRFICGTQDVHKELEKRISAFLGTEDTLLYSSCFDANGGLFETLLSEQDGVISDSLNHASIIDGIRLCRAKRFVYQHGDLDDLERCLTKASALRWKLIASDGVFSMDGSLAKLPQICKLAERCGALVMIDDAHGVGVLGAHGRGLHEHVEMIERVDILTGTLGKALGGATGGYVSGRRSLIELLRQRSRPYLFSNALAPCVASASLAILDLLEKSSALREQLFANTRQFRKGMETLGFEVVPGEHPICAIMIRDAKLAGELAEALLARGILVVPFSYPVVPKGTERIRVQLSAAHTMSEIEEALNSFESAGRELGILKAP